MDFSFPPRAPVSYVPRGARETYTVTASSVTRATIGNAFDDSAVAAEPFWDTFPSATAGGWSILVKQTLRLKNHRRHQHSQQLSSASSSSVATAAAAAAAATASTAAPKPQSKRDSVSSDTSVSTLSDSTHTDSQPAANEGGGSGGSPNGSRVNIIPPAPLFRVQVNAARRQCQIFKIKKSESGLPRETQVACVTRHDSTGFAFTVTEFTSRGDRTVTFDESGAFDAGGSGSGSGNGAGGGSRLMAESDWSVGLTARESDGKEVKGVAARLYFWTPAGHAGRKKEAIPGASVLACDLEFETKRREIVVAEDVLLAAISGYLMLGVEESARKDMFKRNMAVRNSKLFCGGLFNCFFF